MNNPVGTVTRWAALWHSKNIRDGVTEHILYKNQLPVLFRTRREARTWIKSRYGYIKRRTDLRKEPHGWRVPQAVRVVVRMEIIK